MAYYLHCKCYSWQFKSGFGARILPTMKNMVPQSVSFEVPLGPIEDSKLHDAEAEAVIKFAEDEQRAEEEQHAMSLNDQSRCKLKCNSNSNLRRLMMMIMMIQKKQWLLTLLCQLWTSLVQVRVQMRWQLTQD